MQRLSTRRELARQSLATAAASLSGPAAEQTPNVVLFISDQQRADTMPGVRRFAARTPHLEWLASQGTLFRNAYCTTPTCSPARSSLLTGLYPHATGLVANHQERPVARDIHLRRSVRVLADYLRPAGYRCGYFGKWHLGTGADRRGFQDGAGRVFDHDVDYPEQNDIVRFTRSVGISLGGKQTGLETRTGGPRFGGPSMLPLAFHPSLQMAGMAARFVRDSVRAANPFLLAYSCYEPHPPFASPDPFNGMYSPASLPLPDNLRDPIGAGKRQRPGGWDSVGGLAPADLKARWAAYYGAVSYVDHLVGIILAAVIAARELENTVFVFTSDHGEMLGSHGLGGKGPVFYEELVNVPLLIRPPKGLPSPHFTRRLVSHVDLVPTLLAWCGVAQPAGLHGTDLRALATGGDTEVRKGVAFQYHSSNWGDRVYPMRGWRTEEWKYVEILNQPGELYDLRNDPQELHNLFGVPRVADAQRRMHSDLAEWRAQVNDPWPMI